MLGLHHCEWCHQTRGTKWAINGFDRWVPGVLQLLHCWFINPGQWLPASFQEFAGSTQMGVCFSKIPSRLPWLGENHPWCHQNPSCTPSLETTFLCWHDGLGLSFEVTCFPFATQSLHKTQNHVVFSWHVGPSNANKVKQTSYAPGRFLCFIVDEEESQEVPLAKFSNSMGWRPSRLKTNSLQ